MLIVTDTNVLLRLVEPGHSQHLVAVNALRTVGTFGHVAAIVPQILYEFWVVATRPLEANGLDMTTDEAAEKLSDMLARFRLLRDERAVFEQWQRIVVDYEVRGKNAHDARLVAAMQRHGLTHLLTFNSDDFRRYERITSIAPAQVADVLPAD